MEEFAIDQPKSIDRSLELGVPYKQAVLGAGMMELLPAKELD